MAAALDANGLSTELDSISPYVLNYVKQLGLGRGLKSAETNAHGHNVMVSLNGAASGDRATNNPVGPC